MITRLIRILVTQCLSLIVIAVNVNPAVACQTISLEYLDISQSRELKPNLEREHPSMGVYLNNPPEIHIISDRQESTVEFFQRHRIVVGMVTVQDLNKTLTQSRAMPETFSVAYPSSNDDGSGKISTYRLSFKLAPVSEEVIQLWKNKHQSNAVSIHIFLERDQKDSELYHFVGWTLGKQFSFTPEASLPFPLNPQDLWYQER